MTEELVLEEERSEKEEPVLVSLRGRVGAVMVVGGGVSGVQAALDLANLGYKVYLVEETPAIGGRMAQLDKTFPTNDCSMCILSPKLVECSRNPNIEIITNARIGAVTGDVGDFTVTVIKKPRYVDESKCVGCGTCARYCPVKVSDVFNLGLSETKCIHLHFAQTVPLVSVIDPEHCLFLTNRECKICFPVCKNRAIDLYQTEQEIEIRVGAIILSSGYRPYDPTLKLEFGYGRMANVITSLEFERISCASGPYKGIIACPSDKRPPHRIAWIQCVGSRDIVSGNTYCSAVCCMYTIKQVIMSKEHNGELECTVFFNDIRAFGKGFEQYYERAKHLPGVRFIWSTALVDREDSQTGNITLKYCLDGSEVREEEFDLVVLSVGLTPSPSSRELAEIAGVELNPYGFCHTQDFALGETSRQGVYVSGVFNAPADIPESIAGGSAAASLCSQVLSEERGMLVEEIVYPPERDISGEEARVGVFICHCGSNIASVLNMPELVEYSRSLDSVSYAEEGIYSCSADSVRHIAETIQEKGLNRVVVAACTPRTHEPLFQETLREAGLNPYLLEMANIREHCSWVHPRDKEAAIEKAKELLRMAVAKAQRLQPAERAMLPVNQSALVVGGGVSGLICALSLAGQGFEVHLIEKTTRLGGLAQRVRFTSDGDDLGAFLKHLIGKVVEHPLIQVYTGADISQVSGYVGNFNTEISLLPAEEIKEIQHGVAIIATGGEEAKHGEYLYGEHPSVVTLLELEEEVSKAESVATQWRSVAFIGCVGSREESRPYCSRVCCNQMVKCALKLKQINPEIDIYILHRDIRTYGFSELFYQEAAEQGVKFIRYDREDKPVVAKTDDGLEVTVTDQVLSKRLEIPADIVGLAVGVAPAQDNEKLAHLFKVPLNEDGFFMEAHLKLRPVDFATEGVFLCGMAHSPKSIGECISQARAAAGRAATILCRDYIEAPGIVGWVDEERCIGCGLCQSLCAFEAVQLNATDRGTKAEIIPALCKGCGLCAARCPMRAIVIAGFSDEQILSQIAALAAR